MPNSTVFAIEMASLFIPAALVLLANGLNTKGQTWRTVLFVIVLLIHAVAQYDQNFIAVHVTEPPFNAKNAPVMACVFFVLFWLVHLVDNNRGPEKSKVA
jgi:hypothetical protein